MGLSLPRIPTITGHVDVSENIPGSELVKSQSDLAAPCDDMLRAEYKFYLAFENSWCPDYVTEKFIRPFVYDAVPIFLGGADYSHFAPPHSYINARDFESPKALADYLMVSVPDFYGWCELCRMAHDSTLPRKVYHDIKRWWMMDAGNCESYFL